MSRSLKLGLLGFDVCTHLGIETSKILTRAMPKKRKKFFTGGPTGGMMGPD